MAGEQGLARVSLATPYYNMFGVRDELRNNPYINFGSGNNTAVNTQQGPTIEAAKNLPKINTGNQGFMDTVAGWFKPGEGGASTGGNVLGGIASGVNALSGLAGMYYAKKNFDLQKDAQKYARRQDAQRDRNISQFAKNAGGGASYATL